jgi:hypothetical protein
MMHVLLDGLLVLQQHALTVLIILLLMAWGSGVVIALLVPAISESTDGGEMLALALGGWILPVLASAGSLLVGMSSGAVGLASCLLWRRYSLAFSFFALDSSRALLSPSTLIQQSITA